MDNVYVQDALSRNSITTIPDGFAENAGNILYSWLGSLWRSIHTGDKMVRGLQGARGVRLAQLYLDMLEAASLKDRNGAPVFHRELWHPIFIRKLERDTAQENFLKAGMDAVLGPQKEGSDYGEGRILKMGMIAEYEKFVTYPVDSKIVGMAASIVDNIINPTVSMEHDKDFIFRDGAIVFPRDEDPLAKESPFEKYDIPVDGHDPDDCDTECVLWASDVLIDRNYVSDHISYAIGADAPSTDIVKRIVNAAWSSIASGLTPELIKTLMAAMLNIPVIQNEKETIIYIEDELDNDGNRISQLVHTDLRKYRVSTKAKLRARAYPGATLVRGDLLDESLRVYPFLNGIGNEGDGSSGGADSDVFFRTEYSIPVPEDIRSVVLPSDILRVKTRHGVYAMWGESEVKVADDGNENHLYFDIGGSEDDVAAFWHDIWSTADRTGRKMSDFIGKKGSKVSPAWFFIKNLIGANTMFVVVDATQIDDPSKMHDPMFFGMLRSAVPSAIRLFVVERGAVGDEHDMDRNSNESTFLAAVLPEVVERMSYRGELGLDGRTPSFGDTVRARFVRPSPKKIKGRKEEK